jgi:hypothetical protein
MGRKAEKPEEMFGWVREGDGPWKPAADRRVFVVDSGVLPMFGIAPGGAMTLDLNKFWESARKVRKPKPANATRDAEIRRLWNEGRTEGRIVINLLKDYPQITLATVKSVITRGRRMGLLKSHRE